MKSLNQPHRGGKVVFAGLKKTQTSLPSPSLWIKQRDNVCEMSKRWFMAESEVGSGEQGRRRLSLRRGRGKNPLNKGTEVSIIQRLFPETEEDSKKPRLR